MHVPAAMISQERKEIEHRGMPEALRIWRCDLDRPDAVREVLRVAGRRCGDWRPFGLCGCRRTKASPRPP